MVVDRTEIEPEPESAPPSRMVATWATLRTRATALRCLLAGSGAWAITLAPVLLSPRAGGAARVASALALGACVGGSQLIVRHPRLGRLFGVTAYVALALAAWLLAARAGVLAAIDSFRGLLGVMAWAIYALSWSHPWSLPDARLKDAPLGEALGLKPRRKSPRAAIAIAAAGTAAALVCLALAWRVDEGARAVLAQAIATAAAVALVTSSASVAAALGKDERAGHARLPIDRHVVRIMLAFALVAGAAAALHFMH